MIVTLWTEQLFKGTGLNTNEPTTDKKGTSPKETTEMRHLSLERSTNIIERIKI